MVKTRKKEIFALVFCLLLYGADTLYSKTFKDNTENNKPSIVVKPLQSAPAAPTPVIKSKVIPTLTSSPLASMPSPFALLTDNTNIPVPSQNGSDPIIQGSPVIHPPNQAKLPIFNASSGFQSPNLPAFGRDVILKAILYRPGGSNMAILDDGTNEVIAVEGQNTEWGFVSEITPQTVTLDDITLTLVTNQGSRKNRDSNGTAPILKPPSINH